MKKKYVFTLKRQDPEPETNSSTIHESKFIIGIYIIIMCKIYKYTRYQTDLDRLCILIVTYNIDFIIINYLLINTK